MSQTVAGSFLSPLTVSLPIAASRRKDREMGEEVCDEGVREVGSSPAVQGCAGSGGSGEGGSFDCNICLELAQDPVVTMCGHLFCWPCLFRWLELHSLGKECPVCKAPAAEEKVIPLYGRGKRGAADPRTTPVPGVNIPQRPAGHRPYSPANPSPPSGFAGGSVSFSGSDLGLFPSVFHGFQYLHGFSDSSGTSSYGIPHPYHSLTNSYPYPFPPRSEQHQEAFLQRVFLFFLCFVIVCLLFF